MLFVKFGKRTVEHADTPAAARDAGPATEIRAFLWLGLSLTIGTCLGCALPHGPWFHPGGVIAKATTWDALIYEQIATQGYANAASPSPRLAFFPGWPLIWRALLELTGNPALARALAMLISAAAAILSAFAFGRLARTVLPATTAAAATTLYILYPAAHFLFQPYPTAIMQLCIVLALTDLTHNRTWRAAAISGLATAFGPLMVFTSAAITLTTLATAWRAPAKTPRALLKPCLIGILSVSGLLLYILWQTVTFNHPFAFVAAGKAWEIPMTLADHLERAAALTLTVPDLIRAAARLHIAINLATNHQWSAAQISFEDAADLTILFLMSTGAVAALWIKQPLASAALLTIAGFIWFAGAPQGGQAATRLLYPAIASFLGLGLLTQTYRGVITSIFVIFLILDQAFLVAGYWVV